MHFPNINPFPRIGRNMLNRPRQVVSALLVPVVLTLAWVGVESHATAAGKDPCFFSQAQFDDWLSEYGNGYHETQWAGWGDSLSRVQDKFAGGCAGSWGQPVVPGYKCGIVQPLTFRVWSQSDGDQTWIAFKDNGAGASPRYTARCQAGTMKANGDWRFHFWQP